VCGCDVDVEARSFSFPILYQPIPSVTVNSTMSSLEKSPQTSSSLLERDHLYYLDSEPIIFQVRLQNLSATATESRQSAECRSSADSSKFRDINSCVIPMYSTPCSHSQRRTNSKDRLKKCLLDSRESAALISKGC
jgi:hypothetical protein